MEPLVSANKQISAIPLHIKPTAVSTPNGKGKEPIAPRDTKFTFNVSNNANNTTPRPNHQPQQQQQPNKAPSPPAVVAGPSWPPPNPPRQPPPVGEPEPEIEDAYSFPSEDDAFLAEMDLEADIGRPIAYEDETAMDAEFDSASASSGMQPQDGQDRTALATTSYNHSTSNTGPTNRAPMQNRNFGSGGQMKPNSNGGPAMQAKPSSGGFNFPPGIVSTLPFCS
jgi:hypothetical protein